MTSIPLPRPSAATRSYWRAAQEHRLVVPQCRACGHRFFPPQPLCTRCLADDLDLSPSAGRGVVHSYTVIHRPVSPAFSAPYVVAIIELDEGWRMASNVIDCAPDVVRIGMAVEVAFKDMSDEISLPYFRPAGADGPART